MLVKLMFHIQEVENETEFLPHTFGIKINNFCSLKVTIKKSKSLTRRYFSHTKLNKEFVSPGMSTPMLTSCYSLTGRNSDDFDFFMLLKSCLLFNNTYHSTIRKDSFSFWENC